MYNVYNYIQNKCKDVLNQFYMISYACFHKYKYLSYIGIHLCLKIICKLCNFTAYCSKNVPISLY